LKKLLLSIFLCFAFLRLCCQEAEIAAQRRIIAKPANDTALVNAWLDLDNLIYMSDPAEDEALNKKVFDFSEQRLKQEKNKTLVAFYKGKLLVSINNLGIINMYRSDNEEAKKFFTRAVQLSKEMNNKQKIAAAYNNFGVLFYRQGNYQVSIDYYTKGLSIMESGGDLKAMAGALNNIGNIYREIGDTSKALSTFKRSLVLGKKASAKNWEAVSFSAIAEIYSDQGKNDSAAILLEECLRLDREIGNKQGVGSDLANLAKLSLKKGNLADAKEKAEQALALFKEVNDPRATGLALSILSDYYLQKGDPANAVAYGKKALDLLLSIGQVEEAEKAAATLYHIYKMKPDYKNALEAKELYDRLHDTLQNEKNTKAVIHQEFKYEYDKQAALDSIRHAEESRIQSAEIAKKDAELKVKRHIQIMLFAGLAMFLVFSVFIFNRFKVTSRQNKVIEQQKNEVEQKKLEAEAQRALVEEKNREIVDSITYAKRLQEAILPPKKLLKEYLPESFVLYKPKDIVAGDFYWLERKNDIILFAAADCTGHGVPGAMVSVICNNGLNRSVREYGLTDPGSILDKTREIVIQEFEKSEDEVKDGMDISLCAIEGNILRWAGANNPLWIIRENELIELKPDKQPIGKYADQKNFTSHQVELLPGDSLYIFTDGYQDQFGGDKGKKFKSSRMKQLLLSIQDKSMDEQNLIIDHAFESWRSSFDQVDDVCIMGVRP
jgi:serine phosphatase RsbU (regulator of sigma subunit)